MNFLQALRLDVQKWIDLFPLTKLREQARRFFPERLPHLRDSPKRDFGPHAETIENPFHVAVVEQLRAEAFAKSHALKVPTDVFVFAKGEPVHRGTTKIGGLPYWPADKAWPTGDSGKPMSFVSQICFADSADFIGPLPGHVLLVFADGAFGEDWWESDRNALRFEWANLGDDELLNAAQIPENRWKITPFHGIIHRTVDFDFGDDGMPESLWDSYSSPWQMAAVAGTKIGGLPCWIQDEEPLPGRFLCSIAALMPLKPLGCRPVQYFDAPLPPEYFIDRSTDKDEGACIIWGDMGSLYIFMDGDGSVHWTIQYG